MAEPGNVAADDAERRSKVDDAERALVEWLSPGRFRPEDRLPPEHDLAAMLGVSRGTLRAALARLERAGRIRRRRGSGTFVAGNGGDRGETFSAGLEVLESYSLLAARGDVALGCADVHIRRGRPSSRARDALGLDDGASALIIERVLLLEGARAAWMQDVLPDDVALPSHGEVRTHLVEGRMVLDVLRGIGSPISFARTEIRPRLVSPSDRIGEALHLEGPTATLELVETMHVATGRAVQWSLNLFGPGRLQLHVMRALPPGPPPALPRSPD